MCPLSQEAASLASLTTPDKRAPLDLVQTICWASLRGVEVSFLLCMFENQKWFGGVKIETHGNRFFKKITQP